MKQNSVKLNLIGKTFNFYSKVANSQQRRVSGRSLRDWSCWWRNKVLICLLFVNQIWLCSPQTYPKIFESSMGRRSVYIQPKDCIHRPLRILPVILFMFQIVHLIRACVHFICAYRWEYFIPHLMCSLLVGFQCFWKIFVFGLTTSFKLPKEFLGNLWSFVGRDIYSLNNCTWTELEKSLEIVVGDWETRDVLLLIEIV